MKGIKKDTSLDYLKNKGRCEALRPKGTKGKARHKKKEQLEWL